MIFLLPFSASLVITPSPACLHSFPWLLAPSGQGSTWEPAESNSSLQCSGALVLRLLVSWCIDGLVYQVQNQSVKALLS